MSRVAGSRQHHELISVVQAVRKSRRTALPTSHTPPVSPPPSPEAPSLMLCTLAMMGIQLGYAAQMNFGTVHLVHLGLRHSHASLTWLAGPLSGLLFQPLIGALSDACAHPFGRRRLFLIGGCLCTCVSLLAFANAEWVAAPFANGGVRAPLGVAIAAFFALDFLIQAIQASLRALVVDVMPPAKLSAANSCIALYCGIGNLLGGCLVAVPWSRWFPAVSDVQMVFAISALLLIIITSLTVLSTPEKPLIETSGASRSSSFTSRGSLSPTLSSRSSSVSSRLYGTLRGIPSPFWEVFAVQLCTWCGFFALFVYVNSWVGQNVFLGDGTLPPSDKRRQLFDAGVRLGGTANAMTAAVAIGYSCVLPRLLRAYGVTKVYLFSQGVEAVTLVGAMFIRAREPPPPSLLLQLAAVLNVGAFGVIWATTVSVPWTMMVNGLGSDPYYVAKKGLFSTVFNVSQSFPQLVVAVVAPAILAVKDDAAAVMFVGRLVAVVGAVLVVWLRIEERLPKAVRGGDGVVVNVSPMRVL